MAVRLAYINLDEMAADCLLEQEGGELVHYHVSREDWRKDRFNGERCAGSETHSYMLVDLDVSGAPVLVKWLARGLHGLPVNWELDL